jgi:RNA polymerase sigma factor (sigma-70 family)
MAKATILVVDNNRDFLEELGDFLKQGGYSVILAKNLEEAKSCLQKRRYDLVILDVRLTDDDDDTDNSGLMLARVVSADVPKIILTRKPNVNIVRDALGPGVKGRPAAVDFMEKEEVVERLLPALEDAIFIKKLQNGDDRAWEHFWEMEAWSIIALCRRHGFTPDEAVAISMEIFGELVKLIKRPVKRSSLRAQLVSKALQRINKRRVPRKRQSQSSASPQQAGVTGVLLANEELLRDIAAAAIEGKTPRDEMIRAITKAIKNLPPRQQKVVTLRLFRSVPTSAIAKELRVTEKTVLKDMDQGFRHVRSILTQLGE